MSEIISDRIKADTQIAVVAGFITMRSAGVERFTLPPIIDHLCHSCSHATGEHMSAIVLTIFRTKGIVELALIPGGGQEWSNTIRQVVVRFRTFGRFSRIAPFVSRLCIL